MKKLFFILLMCFVSISTAQKSDWKVNYFVDDFGDKTGKKFLSTPIYDGTFSNSATRSSKLCGLVIYTDKNFEFRLIEYCSGNPFVNFGDATWFKFKGSNGKLLNKMPHSSKVAPGGDTDLWLIWTGGAVFDEQDYRNKLGFSQVDAFVEILLTNDYIKALIPKDILESSSSKYMFTFSTKGFFELASKEFESFDERVKRLKNKDAIIDSTWLFYEKNRPVGQTKVTPAEPL